MTRTAVLISAAALISVALSAPSLAQIIYDPVPVTTTTVTTTTIGAPPIPTPVVLLPAQQIDSLTAPIALYPDPLIAQVLTASTYPLDIVTAAQWARYNLNAPDAAINGQPWPSPVKAIVHYPTVLDLLSNNLTWTQQLGSAYLNQPADVMNSVQRLRAQAQASGTLVSSPQQQVIVQSNTIYVIPAQPDIIYVPVYDPAAVYARREPLRFSAAFHIGLWLDLDADWHRHNVVTGVHWDRTHWERFHDLPLHPREEHHIDAPRPAHYVWVRDNDYPVVVTPPRADPEHRFYATPDPHRAPSGFGEYRLRPEVEREESRGRQSLHQPAPARKPPQDHKDKKDHDDRR